MKSIKTRLVSAFLLIMTILSLFPTTAFAASSTGKGITITKNQNYWSTRLLANGTPYSYRPPLVDGKLVYCMDSGLGYHYATPPYLNSFTWTSGTGADADAVLQSALTNSGLSEMDAATVENVKWMMTYLNDCKESNVGQLFMAVQTYVWENQSYKGEPGGDGDAGGYANADTYELYLSLIDSLLAKKASAFCHAADRNSAYRQDGSGGRHSALLAFSRARAPDFYDNSRISAEKHCTFAPFGRHKNARKAASPKSRARHTHGRNFDKFCCVVRLYSRFFCVAKRHISAFFRGKSHYRPLQSDTDFGS